MLAWPAERAAEVGAAYAALMADAPDDLGGGLACSPPPGRGGHRRRAVGRARCGSAAAERLRSAARARARRRRRRDRFPTRPSRACSTCRSRARASTAASSPGCRSRRSRSPPRTCAPPRRPPAPRSSSPSAAPSRACRRRRPRSAAATPRGTGTRRRPGSSPPTTPPGAPGALACAMRWRRGRRAGRIPTSSPKAGRSGCSRVLAHDMGAPAPPARRLGPRGRLRGAERRASGDSARSGALRHAAGRMAERSVMLGNMTEPLAIRLRGVAKRFGDMTAVDGLDLDVPEGTCVGLLGPNGAGKSTTMKMLTAQAIADAGEIPCSASTCPATPSRRARCAASCPQLDNLDVELTARQNLAVFARLYRVPRHERRAAVDRALEIANLGRTRRHAVRQAVRRHAPAAADRARARAPAAAAAARRADRRARPAGPPGAVGADRRAAQRGHVDPDVDALHRGGRAARRHRCRSWPTARSSRAGRPADARARARRASRRSRSTGRRRGSPRCARRPRRGLPRPPHRHRGRDPRRRGRPTARCPRACRRAASLEDVFVLLTGEEVE